MGWNGVMEGCGMVWMDGGDVGWNGVIEGWGDGERNGICEVGWNGWSDDREGWDRIGGWVEWAGMDGCEVGWYWRDGLAIHCNSLSKFLYLRLNEETWHLMYVK